MEKRTMRILATLTVFAIIVATPSARAEANDISHRIFGGYSFGPYFALSAEYFDGGALAEDAFDSGLEFGGSALPSVLSPL
jgi:hypothetical protein